MNDSLYFSSGSYKPGTLLRTTWALALLFPITTQRGSCSLYFIDMENEAKGS